MGKKCTDFENRWKLQRKLLAIKHLTYHKLTKHKNRFHGKSGRSSLWPCAFSKSVKFQLKTRRHLPVKPTAHRAVVVASSKNCSARRQKPQSLVTKIAPVRLSNTRDFDRQRQIRNIKHVTYTGDFCSYWLRVCLQALQFLLLAIKIAPCTAGVNEFQNS